MFGLTCPLERPPSDIMKLKSSAKLRRLDWVMGERGSRIFCCMSNAYLQISIVKTCTRRSNVWVLLHPQGDASLEVPHVCIDGSPIPDVVAGVRVRWAQDSLSHQQGLKVIVWIQLFFFFVK